MASRFAIAFGAALLLTLPGGAAFAQAESEDSFYADPVLADPPQKPEHLFSAAIATQDVAAVSPAAGEVKLQEAKPAKTARNNKPASGACSALNPCAVTTPAARS